MTRNHRCDLIFQKYRHGTRRRQQLAPEKRHKDSPKLNEKARS